jgi:Cys-tRNA(Pro)/Cys-tRNA(Cys) deacylase
MTAMAGARTPAVAALEAAGIPHRVHDVGAIDRRVEHPGEVVAAQLGVATERVLKTLVADADETLVVAVLPLPTTLDLKALAAVVGAKRARLADGAAAQRATGFVVGGLSPFGQRRSLRTIVATAAVAHETVFVSGGRRGLEIEVSPLDLVAACAAQIAAITA